MTGFKLTIQMAAPIVLNTFNPLDATLCGILFGGRDDVSDITLDCIEYQNCIPMASLPFLENWAPLNYSMRPNIDRHLADSRSMESRVNRKSTTMVNGGDDSKNECYNIGTTGRCFETPTVSFYFIGDGKEVRRIINDAGAIGGQTSKGYGTIVRGESRLEEVSDNMCGMLVGGKLARPIPVALAKNLGVEKHQWIGMMGRASAPYRPGEVIDRGLAMSHIAYPRQWLI